MFQDETPAQAAQTGAVKLGAGAIPNSAPTAGREGVCRILLKVVPGSRTTAVVGALGDRLKVKVAAPQEDGRANAAVCALIAERLGVGKGAVSVIAGVTNAEKTLRVVGVTAERARSGLLDAAR